jgi:putative transposase
MTNSLYQSGVKFAASPDSALASVLAQWIGCQRFIYNGKVQEDRYFSTFYRRTLALTGTDTPLDQQYAQFKDRELTPWLYDVPSQILRNGAVRWRVAKERQLKGLARAPRKKKAHGRQSVLVTSELFRFIPDGNAGLRLQLGTEKNPVGVLKFRAHRPYKVPTQLVVSREAGRWFVSFSYEAEAEEILRTPEELSYELNMLSDEELVAVTLGGDRGIVKNLADSDGRFYVPSAICEERKATKARYIKRQQRRLARQQKGSVRRTRTRLRIAKASQYAANCRLDFAHKVSHALTNQSARLLVFEDLHVEKMSRRAKPKLENGKYVKNGARAKSGLNRSIREAAWGKIVDFAQYKAARQNKLVLKVPPQYTSQECSSCGHIHPDNRVTQDTFICQLCGYSENADVNAARVVKKRGIAALRAGVTRKPKKSVAVRRKTEKSGPVRPKVLVERDLRPERAKPAQAPCVETRSSGL